MTTKRYRGRMSTRAAGCVVLFGLVAACGAFSGEDDPAEPVVPVDAGSTDAVAPAPTEGDAAVAADAGGDAGAFEEPGILVFREGFGAGCTVLTPRIAAVVSGVPDGVLGKGCRVCVDPNAGGGTPDFLAGRSFPAEAGTKYVATAWVRAAANMPLPTAVAVRPVPADLKPAVAASGLPGPLTSTWTRLSVEFTPSTAKDYVVYVGGSFDGAPPCFDVDELTVVQRP